MIETLADLVPAQAQLRPDEPAVGGDGDPLSWRQFDDELDRTAGALARLGVGRGDRVGVLLHKSVRTPIAVHGTLRVGAAYVPLDPLAPDGALAAIAEDCGVEVVVTDEPAARRVAGVAGAAPSLRAVVGPTGASGLAGVAWDDRPRLGSRPSVDADDLAYIMYTSGSTGHPKGIMHTHRSGLAYATRAAETYDLTPADRLGFLTPIHFDMSTFELFAGPVAGACTVVVPEPHLRLPASLAQLIADQRLTTLYGVPFLFTQLLDRGALAEHDLDAVRWLLYGGEPFPAARLAELMALLPGCRVSNVYGPAEVNQCTFHHLDQPPDADGVVPIGACWDGALGRVTDSEGNIVGSGLDGELWIAAPTMMSGYWRRPDLTAAATVTDEGRRWFRTGDLVREVEPGVYQYLGRRDDQVKVRGHRLELSPVELAAASLDGVRHAVAGVVTGTEGASELVLVYVGSAEPDAVIRHTAAALPAYAVPTRAAAIDDLPIGATGKIDRRRVRLEHLPELFGLTNEVTVP